MNFWDLPYDEQKNVVNNRMYSTKFVVYDYARDIDGSIGIMVELGTPIDKGFIHGFVINHKAITCRKWYEINVYTNAWYVDEEYQNKTPYYRHYFTTKEKAEAYLKECKHNNPTITLERILPIIKKYCSDAHIAVGKRGYESVEYKCITAQGGYITFKVLPNNTIYFSWNSITIPHVDALEKVMQIYTNGEYAEDRYNEMLEWVGY